ncbi:phage major capsid protein [Microbacterium sp. YY-01]|uniref:phage major capsid family protein n=1 Tax=Microbacterium sp. YY-01 TaxID=3421634 RepID=UPI003D177F17
MVSLLTTGELNLPDHIIDPWLTKVKAGSTIAALSNAIPMKFGKSTATTLDIGEAEYVGEGANKGPSDITKKIASINPYKFHKTVRWTDEVKWADEEYQLGVVAQILEQIQPALARALDYSGYHGINPTGGAPVAAMTDRIAGGSNVVTVGSGKAYEYIDAADTLVLAAGYVPSGIALAPSLAARFATARAVQTEQKLYPGFRLDVAPSELEGHRASVSRTVSAVGVAATPTNVEGVVGDFDSFGWGVQRSIGLRMIEYGDPDGQGDLQRNNQVAFRAEIVYGWGIADEKAFAVLKSSGSGD